MICSHQEIAFGQIQRYTNFERSCKSKVLKSDSLQRPISWIDHNVFTSWHQPQCQTAVLRWGFLVGTVMLNVARSKSICWTGLVLFLSSFQPACRNEWNSRSWGGYWVAEIFMSLISFYSESSVFKVLIVYESVTSRLTWRKHGQNLRTLKPGCCFHFLMFSVRKSYLSSGWFRKSLNILSAFFTYYKTQESHMFHSVCCKVWFYRARPWRPGQWGHRVAPWKTRLHDGKLPVSKVMLTISINFAHPKFWRHACLMLSAQGANLINGHSL